MESLQLFQLIYISRAVSFLTTDDLHALLNQAREKNALYSLTGLLLYKDLSFIQVLEGTEASIRQVFSSIQKDSRHFRVKVLVDCEPIEERAFPEWLMGFQQLDDSIDNSLPGFSNFLQTGLNEAYHYGDKRDQQTLNALLQHFRHRS